MSEPQPDAGRASSVIPNRGHLLTEQRLTDSAGIDACSVEQTLRIINQQDATVPQALRHAIPQLTPLVEHVARGMAQGGRLIYVGAGTSGRLGVLDASEIPPTFHAESDRVIGIIAGGDGALRVSSEGMEDDPEGALSQLDELSLGEHDTLVGVAAGGTTPYVWGAIGFAKQRGASTGLVCCVSIKTLKRRPAAPLVAGKDTPPAPGAPELPAPLDFPVELLVGPEVVTGSTRMKAGTATKLALNMITTSAMIQLGKVWGNLMIDLKATNAKLRDRAVRILTSQTDLDRGAAAELLEKADGRVKLALVMALSGVGVGEAEALLEAHDQQLRAVLGAPR